MANAKASSEAASAGSSMIVCSMEGSNGGPIETACSLVGRFQYHFGRVEQKIDQAVIKLDDRVCHLGSGPRLARCAGLDSTSRLCGKEEGACRGAGSACAREVNPMSEISFRKMQRGLRAALPAIRAPCIGSCRISLYWCWQFRAWPRRTFRTSLSLDTGNF
jgi:hypothetical protein